ncbi:MULTISPECIES: glycosyltransferase [unclassified Kaistella]|uniref:glycosyltransferase family 2 protein n=1 Tax=unclassified Kaistella TaxID=2762626 RepID=UPI002734E33B|nr:MULTISPECIES: glycosyltransferase [unclassified Kaistella]MDP2452524.1 glycosyltransferase [Kaistella sp. SH11-4b]MDP2455432.1 glycosyltransferase [Kaistella sp. SH40-3]MDP2458336.1 glycosyltransferase [Kaistella sp. SH19-2b]
MKLSIIIPVYNSEKYLGQCLQSVCDQDLPKSDYEIIVINDGSKDGSREIILSFKARYNNIIFIDQENKGVSAARNTGLDLALGEYVTFVDSDDEIYANSLQQQVTYIKENNLDLLYPKITYINARGEVTGEFKMNSETGEILDGFIHQRRGYIVAFYKRELIKDIRFNLKISIAEDSLFNIEVHAIAKRCGYLRSLYYKYRKGIISTSNSKTTQSEKAFDGMIEQLWCIKRLIEANKDIFTEKQVVYYDRPFYVTIEMMMKVNVIPTISLSRFKMLKREMKRLNIEYIADKLEESLPFFKAHWLLFFAYHSPKVFEYRIKTYIYKKLLQSKMIVHK